MRSDFNPEFNNFASRIFNGDHFGRITERPNFIHLSFDDGDDGTEYSFRRVEDEYEVTYRFRYFDADGYENELYIDDCSEEFETANDLSVTFGFVHEANNFDEEIF